MLCHNLLIGKGKHVHREPRVFWEDTRQPVEGGSECRATHLNSRYRPHTTASNGEVYRGNRHYNVCELAGLDTNQACITLLRATSWGDGPLKYPWARPYVRTNMVQYTSRGTRIRTYKCDILSKTTRNTSTPQVGATGKLVVGACQH